MPTRIHPHIDGLDMKIPIVNHYTPKKGGAQDVYKIFHPNGYVFSVSRKRIIDVHVRPSGPGLRRIRFLQQKRGGKQTPTSSLPKSSCPGSMLQHILNKYPIPLFAVLDQHMGDSPDESAVLYDGASAQGHVNTGVKDFSRFLEKIISICRKPYIFDYF